ncbi:MAG: hypothetical protein ACQETD_08380 [Pseudomonadota bacterium]
MTQPSHDSLQVLEALRRAVEKALERKRRLGQYAVIWQDGKPVILGEEEMKPTEGNDGAT